MKKKIIILLAILCIFGVLILINCFDGGIFISCGESPIEKIVVKSIKIQYKCCGDDTEAFNSIFTSEFIEHIKTDPHFHKKMILLRIDKKFVNSIIDKDNNQFSTEVQVTDSSGTYFQEITLIRDSNGNYKISNIEYDI